MPTYKTLQFLQNKASKGEPRGKENIYGLATFSRIHFI